MEPDNSAYHGTTIISVRRNGVVAIGGDGQVTLGSIVVKHSARKVRRLYHDRILAGFAGATADAFTLFERFEGKLEKHQGNLLRSAVELAGQLVGDIGATLKQLDTQLAAAPMVTVSCAKLIRVDFIAAGDLLNWVLSKRGENRSVTFAEAHRLVALFFGAMGINEHASVRVKNL